MQHFKTLIFIIAICTWPLQGIWYDVCIDPGHCGITDGGAPGGNGGLEPDESDFNLYIGLVCEMDLWSLGWSVILTRHTDWFAFVPTKEKRVWCRFSEPMDTGQETRISGDQEEGYQDIRISGYQRIREFKNNNFQINKILNIKINTSLFKNKYLLNRVNNICTINQRKRRYEGLDTFYNFFA